MSTTYYLLMNKCPVCGKADKQLTIGRSSAGWCFALNIIPQENIHSLHDWSLLFKKHTIIDEYSRQITADEMLSIIKDRHASPNIVPQTWYNINHAIPGPNNLARHVIDNRFCVGHGDGTWDYVIGL